MKDLFYPDHSVCITCHKPISWDDYGYTHDDTGFADCGIALDLDPLVHGVSLVKEIHQFSRYEGATARPNTRLMGYL